MDQLHGAPKRTDKYFIMKTHGGWSPCIEGNNAHGLRPFPGSVLPNCVAAATGAFNKIIGAKACKYLGNTNAENFLALAKKQGLQTGSKPRPGCVMVWEGIGSKAGHVAFVNDLQGETAKTWESGWNYKTKLINERSLTKGAGNWGMSSAYKYIGSIYNPAVNPYKTPRNVGTIKKGSSTASIKWLQWNLVQAGCYTINNASQIDGSFGKKTEAALKKYQKKAGDLTVDGHAGPKTQAKMREQFTLGGWY